MISILLTYLLILTAFAEPLAQDFPSPYQYQILQIHEHSTDSFTQGLLVDGDHLIESSGLYGLSFIERYDHQSGTIDKRVTLPENVFAEGIAQLAGNLYCLSWKSGIVFIFDQQQLTLKTLHHYQGQGWGLATIGSDLIMSDGSDQLTWREPIDFSIIKRIQVTMGGEPVYRLNDLTFGMGLIWANIWQRHQILAIDPATGVVTGVLDLSELARKHTRDHETVLNGVAWDNQRQGLWITGKRWDKRYLLRVITADQT